MVEPIRFITSREDAAALNEELLAASAVTAVDTEGYSEEDEEEGEDREEKGQSPVNNGLAFSIQFSYRDGYGRLTRILVLTYGEYGGNLYELAPFLMGEAPKVMHNAPHDVHTLGNHGIPVGGPLYDTLVEVHGLDQNRKFKGGYGLKACVSAFFKRVRYGFKETFWRVKLKKDGTPYASRQLERVTLEDYLGVKHTLPPDSWEQVVEYGQAECEQWREDRNNGIHYEMSYWGRWYNFMVYACNDTWDTLELHERNEAEYRKLPWGSGTYWDWFTQHEAAVTRELIIPLERRGMLVDLPFLEDQRVRCEADLEELRCQISEWAQCPLEIGKDKQLAMLLHGEGAQPVYKGASKYKGGPKSKVDYYIPGWGIPVLDVTDGGEPSMKAESLARLQDWAEKEGRDDLAGLKYVVEYSKTDKQRGTYLVGMRELAQPWVPTAREREYANSVGWSDGLLDALGYGVVRTILKQAGPSSGRWASKSPNLQNITTGKKDRYHLRDAFVAPPGYVVVCWDFSNLEYRLLAHFTNDPLLCRMFREGYDMHSYTAYNVFPEVRAAVDAKFGSCTVEAQKWIKENFADIRDRKAKVLNFEIIYGVGPGKLAEQLKLELEVVQSVPSLARPRSSAADEERRQATITKLAKDKAWQMINNWFAGYANVRPWKERLLQGARDKGYVRTLMGRYRFADMSRLCGNDKFHRGEEERTLANATIQGSAADITKQGMLRLNRSQRLAELDYAMVMQVHDEILGYCPEENVEEVMDISRELLTDVFGKPLRVPFPVSGGYGPSWASAKH